MLKTGCIIFSANVIVEDIISAFEQLNIHAQNGYWIYSIPPLRHVRFRIEPINEFELTDEQMNLFSSRAVKVSEKGIWFEMSSEESGGRLAAMLCARIVHILNDGVVIDENDRMYEIKDLDRLVAENKGFYE